MSLFIVIMLVTAVASALEADAGETPSGVKRGASPSRQAGREPHGGR